MMNSMILCENNYQHSYPVAFCSEPVFQRFLDNWLQETHERFSPDSSKIWTRFERDLNEIWTEIWTRFEWDLNEIWTRFFLSHLDLLHERLAEKYTFVPIPQLPDKQIQGRYEEDLLNIEWTSYKVLLILYMQQLDSI